jgi:hypothetical protein
VVDETWTVTTITAKGFTEKSSSWESKDAEVTYVWGPPGGQRRLHDMDSRKAWIINDEEMNNWLQHPTRSYLGL